MNQLDWEKKHYKRVAGYAKQMDEIFTEAAKEAAAIGALFDANDLFSQPFSFKDYPQTKQRVDKMMQDLHKGVSTVVVNGATAEWENSNLVNDQLSMRVLGIADKDQIPDKFRKYFNNNNQALKAFLERKEKGLNLSDRVWKYTNAFKQEIELGLDAGIRAGKPASEMARDLKQYLREPNKLFRRVRDQHGNLQLSRAAKAYHPGRGVYRSSYKNAMRLTRTETNMAYRAANHTRMQQLDFVVGIEVRLTNNPAHIYDICDELKGRYPKDFKFVGWHPHCMCHAITILKTPQELDQDIEKIQNGEPTNTASQNKVEGLPQNFKEWAERNKDRIATAKSQPYFIRDNFTGAKVEDWFKIQQVVPAAAIPAPLEVPMAQRVLAKTENEMPEELKNFLKHNPDAKIIEFKVEQLREKIITWEQNNYNVSPTDKAKVDALVAMTKKQWDNLPPVIYERYTVDGGWKVIDGWHRTAAAIRRGETKINAVVKDYLTAAEKSAARHAARTPEQRAAIQKAWDERKMPEELRNFLKHNPDAKIIEFKTEQLREKIITWEQNNYNVSPTDKAKVDALVAMTKKQWDNLPPVIYERYTVDGGWKVIDGWHRTAAAIRRGETKINAAVKDYLTAAEKSAARHAARTPEQRAAIQKAWDERKKTTSTIQIQIKTAEDARIEISRIGGSDWFTSGFNKFKITSHKGVNGSTSRAEGIISLSKVRMNATKSGLEKIRIGAELTKKEADALATFWHEITHNRNAFPKTYSEKGAGTKYMELANEFISRKTLPEFYQKLGVKDMPFKEFMTTRASTGYNDMVRNFQTLINEMKLSDEKVTESVKRKLFRTGYDRQKEGLIASIIDNLSTAGINTKNITFYEIEEMMEQCLALTPIKYRTWIQRYLKKVIP